MAFSVDKFRKHFASHGDFSRPSRFDVLIHYGSNDTRGLTFQCEGTELPGFVINTAEAKVYGPSWHIATVPTFSDITLTFLCSGDMWEKKFFDYWMYQIVPMGTYDSLEISPHLNYRDNYTSTIKIRQFRETSDSDIPYQVAVLDAFPSAVAPLALSWADDGIHRMQVTFKYRKWQQITNPAYNPDGVAANNDIKQLDDANNRSPITTSRIGDEADNDIKQLDDANNRSPITTSRIGDEAELDMFLLENQNDLGALRRKILVGQ